MHYTYPNGDEVYIAEVVYICDKFINDLKVQEDEVIVQRFFDLDELPLDISPMNIEVINSLAEYIKNE